MWINKDDSRVGHRADRLVMGRHYDLPYEEKCWKDAKTSGWKRKPIRFPHRSLALRSAHGIDAPCSEMKHGGGWFLLLLRQARLGKKLNDLPIV